MRKGVIFTLDAVLALSIFIAASIGFYQFFSSTTTFGSSGANVYSYVDNYFGAYDNSEAISKIYKKYQLGNTTGALDDLKFLADEVGYPVNVEVYVWNGTSLNKELEVREHSFDEYFVLRRYLVLTVTEGLGSQSGNVSVSAPSSLAGRNVSVVVNFSNPTTPGVFNFTLWVEDCAGSQVNWNITPKSQIVPVGVSTSVAFNVSVPSDAVVDEYVAVASVEEVGGGFQEERYDNFNVFRYGMLVVEADSRR
ncbi:MAG: hypothetical protein J7K73_02220 [Nanoarchaeota archaeon]|nr:hypothetical protein [Nanoarchaeota archaeon]